MNARVDLYWIPLGAGAGGELVRWSGRLYEAVVAARGRRPRRALFHSALELCADGVVSTIEMAPVWIQRGDRGVVAEGPVGARFLGWSRLFRYEVRCWAGAGEIWNSNSLVAWLLARAGLWTNEIGPPPGGRAPGWDAGLKVAARSQPHSDA